MNRKSIKKFYDRVLGINKRNLRYVYPSNPRRYFPVANNKVITKKFLSKHDIPVPKTYIIISKMGYINSEWDKMSRLEDFVIKSSKGKAGGGILVLKKDGDKWLDPSERPRYDDDIKKHMADIVFGVYSFGLWDKVMIEYRIYPDKLFKDIFSRGVPDIRLVVYKDTPVSAMVRMPTDKSGGRANLHQNAIGIGVDIATGIMGDGYDYKGYFETHPDTGVRFKGTRIPCWDEILKISKMTIKAVPLDYLGVDIVIDEKRGPLVMEINARPGLEIQNVNKQGLMSLLKGI